MKSNKIYWIFVLPSLLGVSLFYVIPFVFAGYYAVIDNLGSKRFVGLHNFTELLSNPLFLQAGGNTLCFMAISIPLSMGLALLLALCLQRIRRGKAICALSLLLPMVVPSGTIVYFWNILFSNNGLLQKTLIQMGFPHAAVSQMDWTMLVLVVIYLWKNTSYNIVLFWSGLNWIPKTYYEQMEIEGGGGFQQFTQITWIYLSPTTFIVLLMSTINSFRIFREVYMLYGAYPSPHAYMLQHYMNNQFATLNMQKLASAAYIIFFVISLVLLAVFYAQKRVSDQ